LPFFDVPALPEVLAELKESSKSSSSSSCGCGFCFFLYFLGFFEGVSYSAKKTRLDRDDETY
jgi:hypothetical protein